VGTAIVCVLVSACVGPGSSRKEPTLPDAGRGKDAAGGSTPGFHLRLEEFHIREGGELAIRATLTGNLNAPIDYLLGSARGALFLRARLRSLSSQLHFPERCIV